jgi:hypothetical protein
VRLDFREGKVYGGQGATPAIAFARSAADLAADHEIWCGRDDARSAANPSEQSPAEAASFRKGGGTIAVDSRVGEFTEFAINLPRTRHAATAEAAA